MTGHVRQSKDLSSHNQVLLAIDQPLFQALPRLQIIFLVLCTPSSLIQPFLRLQETPNKLLLLFFWEGQGIPGQVGQRCKEPPQIS